MIRSKLDSRAEIGIYHMMLQSLPLTPSQDYVWPPYSDATYQMSDAQMRQLKEAGFDFIRLSIAPDVFMRADAARTEQLYSIVQTIVSRFLRFGLKVIADLHPTDSMPSHTVMALVADLSGKAFQRYIEIACGFAEMLSQFPANQVALELMNEPPLWKSRELMRWQSMAEALHTRLRRISSDLVLVVSGPKGGSIDGLLALNPAPFSGKNVLFSFHYYDPMIFTHQSVDEKRAYLTGVPWPAVAGNFEQSIERARQAVARDDALSADQKAAAMAHVDAALKSYFASGTGPKDIEAAFARVAHWADLHQIPKDRILLGEFGVNRTVGSYAGALDQDRLRWLSTVRTAAENNGFGWALWQYSCPCGMTLANEWPAKNLDAVTLNALGLDT